MIVCLKPFTMRGVRYGPPARPDFYRAQLAEVRERLARLETDWAARLEVAEIKSILTGGAVGHPEQDRLNYEAARSDLLSVVERLTKQIAEEELPVKQVMPKAEWDTLSKYKQRNFVAARYVAQREGRKLQEA